MTIHIYPEKMENFILSKTLYIPRKLQPKENLKQYHRYWNCFSDCYFKVNQTYQAEEVEYYSIKFRNSLYGEIPCPISTDYFYELLIDHNNIQNIENIINDKISYKGSEIRFWFFIHNIDLESEKYSGFLPFINYSSKSSISDDKDYFVYAFYNNNKYKDCKISLDRRKKGEAK